jgi:hypothetical protein
MKKRETYLRVAKTINVEHHRAITLKKQQPNVSHTHQFYFRSHADPICKNHFWKDPYWKFILPALIYFNVKIERMDSQY